MNKERLSIGEKIGYSIGDLGTGLIFQTMSLYMLYFYTDVFGISAAAVATLFLIARLWDGINDPIMGAIVDKTHTRWGKFRPYILWGVVPVAIFAVLCFSTPDLSDTGKLIYAYITYIGLGMTLTLVVLPYSALTSSISQDEKERGIISAMRVFFSMLGGVVVAIGVNIFTKVLSGGDEAAGYQRMMIIFATICVVTLLISFASTKERHTENKSKVKVTLKSTINLLKTNRPLQILCLAFVVVFGNFSIGGSVGVYFFTYNLNRPELFPVNMVLSIVTSLIALLFLPLLLKKMEKKNILIMGLLLTIIRPLCLYTMSIPLIMIGTVIASIGRGLAIGVIWGLVPDTIEYGEYKTGIRAEGMIYAIVGFFVKFGTAIGGLVPGFILEWTGYVPKAVQTSTALMGIQTIIATVPLILSIVCVLILRFYTLDSKTYNQILGELNSRA